jgi:hypothetical protein
MVDYGNPVDGHNSDSDSTCSGLFVSITISSVLLSANSIASCGETKTPSYSGSSLSLKPAASQDAFWDYR